MTAPVPNSMCQPADDPEILAIRQMVQEQKQDAQAMQEPAETGVAPLPASPPKAGKPARKAPSKTLSMTKQMIDSCARRLRAYRPDRNSILATSFVLLVVLRPMLVATWLVIALIVVIGSYICMGHDGFWRRIIALYHLLKNRRPGLARQIKLRAFAAAKKWDKYMAKLPSRIGQVLSAPDLRSIQKADAQHDAVLTDRLRRLDM